MTKKLHEKFPQLLERFGGTSEHFHELLLNFAGKLPWRCGDCSELVHKTISAVIQKGTRCSSCAHEISARGRRAASVAKYGSIADDKQLLPFFRSPAPELVPLNSKKIYSWSCSACGGVFEAMAYGARALCGNCIKNEVTKKAHETRLKLRGSLSEKRPELSKAWCGIHSERSPQEVTEFSGHETCWICENCSRHYLMVVHMRSFSGQGCPSCGKKSRLETILAEELEGLGVPHVRHSRPLRLAPGDGHGGSGALELDFLLPQFSLAFEVQDFATHSRISDQERTPWEKGFGKFKKGPTYHELKRRLALEQLGVTLVDIWQDEIENGNYRELIVRALGDATKKLSL